MQIFWHVSALTQYYIDMSLSVYGAHTTQTYNS